MRNRWLLMGLAFYAALVILLILAPLVLAKPPAAATCTGTMAHATLTEVTVPQGGVCRVSDSVVSGTITVGRNGYFEAQNTKVGGEVRAVGALAVFLHDGTSVTGNVLVDGTSQLFMYRTSVVGTARVTGGITPGFGHIQICDSSAGGIDVRGAGPDVLVGDPAAGCPGNHVKKDLVVIANSTVSELDISGNLIGGSLIVTGNHGNSPKHVAGNAAHGRVDISNNDAPFDASGNG